MADFISGCKIAAVRLEGTVTDKADLPYDLGDVKHGVRERLEALRTAGYHVVIVSGLTGHQHGIKILFKFLADNAIPYDEVFCSFGLPAAELWFDDRAEPLTPRPVHADASK